MKKLTKQQKRDIAAIAAKREEDIYFFRDSHVVGMREFTRPGVCKLFGSDKWSVVLCGGEDRSGGLKRRTKVKKPSHPLLNSAKGCGTLEVLCGELPQWYDALTLGQPATETKMEKDGPPAPKSTPLRISHSIENGSGGNVRPANCAEVGHQATLSNARFALALVLLALGQRTTRY